MSDNGFGERLHALRTGAGISQEQLAQRAGISVRALSNMERGRARGPRLRTVEALVAALGLDGVVGQELEDAARLGRPRAVGGTGPKSSAGTGPGSGAIGEHPLALPRDLRDFTARGRALEDLRVLVERGDPAHPAVVVVCGQPGLGKTAFAVHAAHVLAPGFPDGQFAVDLRGMDPKPTAPREALARLLHAFGVAEAAVPAATDDRSGLLRSVLRERRVLLLLDNAADEGQVRPLLPGHGPSLTLVTSRRSLAGLESVHRTELALLRREEAVELLTRVIGPDRVHRESQASRDLAELCGHLPLAVRIAAQRLASRPGETLTKLVAQLAEHETRLDHLEAGSLRVRAAFALSYQQLPPSARTVFRRACLADGPDFSPTTAALLADLPLRQAARCTQHLTDAGLLQPHPTADRYRFHDLLRLFAAEQLAEEDEPAHITAARDRADRWALRRATAAARLFDTEPHPETPPDPAAAVADRDRARIWLEAERPQWLAALHRAHTAGHHQQVIDTAQAMHWFSDRTPHWELWAQVFRCAVGSARALGSRRDEAVHLNYLSWAYNMCLYDHTAALTAAQHALAAARECGDQLQIGWALGYTAGALHRLGRTEESITRLHEATEHLRQQTGAPSRLAELTVLNSLGHHLRQVGRPHEALTVHRRSEAICRAGVPGQLPELIGLYLAVTRQHLGNDLAALHRWNEAEEPLRCALTHFEAAQMPAWSEPARLDLGIVLRHLNRHHEAHTTLTTAHDALVRLNNPRQIKAADELHQLNSVFDIAGHPTD
ncbi:helix-turn-helix domain-containing protein [Streptomyces sp. NBC_01383]|uniref:tetratricopeptide repeat protein n=1 Tax=Streptomyces sp. NBC_01383 TaxID=2903846 RepID=UPI00324ADF16